jgi:4-amino-4-deoxy-L-arabinose transferase-like glycosyltransferase
MAKCIPWLGTAGLYLLLAAALWCRTTSLEAIPEVHGDETWYGVQVGHMLRGESFETRTYSGNPLNPFFSGLMVPLHLAVRPTGWILRLPAVLCGILAVVATFVIGSKVLDRTTAIIAAALLAVLPAAIVYGRTAFDCSQLSLFGMVILGFAFQARPIALLVSFLLSLLVHPTGVFLLPAALAVFSVQTVRKRAGDSSLIWRAILITSASAVVAGVGLSLIALRRPFVMWYFAHHYRPPQDWPRFALGFGRFLLALGMPPHEPHLWVGWLPTPPETRLGLQDGLLWAAVLGALLFGVRRLWRDRAWDRLALVAGTVAAVAGFHLIAGSIIFEKRNRYGVVLILPVVLSFACLVEAILTDALDDERRSDRRFQFLTLVAIGWLILGCAKLNWFDPRLAGGAESFWTFRSEAKNSHKRALSIIRHDLRKGQRGTGPATVVVQPIWTEWPLQYYTLGQRDLNITSWIQTDPPMDRGGYRLRLASLMEAGAYAVSYAGGEVEQDVSASFPAERLRSWEVPLKGRRWLVVYRLKRPGESETGTPSSPAASVAATPGNGQTRR